MSIQNSEAALRFVAVSPDWNTAVTERRASVPGATGVIVFVMFLCLLFLLQLGGAGAAGGMVMAGGLAVLNRRRLGAVLGARAFLFLIPALCLLSALWSEAPGASLWYGVEMTATVAAALVLSVADRRTEMLAGLAAAFAVYAGISLVFGHTAGAGTQWAAFSGLNGGKNFMAELASTGVLCSAGFVAAAAAQRRIAWAPAIVAAVLAAMVELYILILAKSAGAIIALGVGGAILAALLVVSRFSAAWRTTVVGTVGLIVALVAIFHEVVAKEVSSFALKAFDKDPTLTGRTYLWYRADKMIAEKPLLGHGYNAFWREGNPDAEGLWRFGGIDNKSGFNFHNTGVEVLMQFGWVGAVLLAAVVLIGVLFLVGRYVRRPDALTCFWLALAAFELTRTFYESIGPMPFYFSNILIIAALGSAFHAAAPPHRPARS
jgi:exopolysaccharide production protein ExoQ